MERIRFTLVGEFEGLIDGVAYDLPTLCYASGLRFETLRERLHRKNARDTVLATDLAPLGMYRQIAQRCETSSERFSQEWLSKPLVGQI